MEKMITIPYSEYMDLKKGKVSKKNYDILKFEYYDGAISVKCSDDLYRWENNKAIAGATLDEMLHSIADETNKIYSVRRLSDGEVFTVGDKVDRSNGQYKEDAIRGFNISKDRDYILVSFTDYIDRGYCGNKGCNISIIEHFKKPLFTTEDGVDLFKGDTYYQITHDFEAHRCTAYDENNFDKSLIIFSTKEAAEMYILENERCLSINDINNSWEFTTNREGKFVHGSGTIQNLVELINSRK